MAQIKTKFIQDDAVNGSKFKLLNNQSLRARNAGDSADVNLLKLNASDILEFQSQPTFGSDPVNANDLVRKVYLDNLLNGLKWKATARAASTADVALTGGATLTVDGVALANDDRLLLKNQTATDENGIYVVSGIGSSYALTRAADVDSSSELVNAAVFVSEGTANADKGYVQTADAPIVVDTDPITWVQFTSAGSFIAGNGIDITGTTVSVAHDGEGLTFSGTDLALELDGSTLSKSASGVKVAALGITAAELAADSVDKDKINADVAGFGLDQNANGSLEVSPVTDLFTLIAGDITNQYVDLSFAALDGSIKFEVVGAPTQSQGTDFTISLTGGAGGVTRITFAGDLATAGAAALVATDKLEVRFIKK